MKEKQFLIGVSKETKDLVDKYYKENGFTTRSSYIKSLVQRDNASKTNVVENTNPDLLE